MEFSEKWGNVHSDHGFPLVYVSCDINLVTPLPLYMLFFFFPKSTVIRSLSIFKCKGMDLGAHIERDSASYYFEKLVHVATFPLAISAPERFRPGTVPGTYQVFNKCGCRISFLAHSFSPSGEGPDLHCHEK